MRKTLLLCRLVSLSRLRNTVFSSSKSSCFSFFSLNVQDTVFIASAVESYIDVPRYGWLSWNCVKHFGEIVVQSLSHVQRFAAPRIAACQAPLSMDFPANTGWLTVFFSRGSSSRKDRTLVSCVGSWIYYHWATWEALGEINSFQMETYVFSF